jgi:hypothetical protein
MFPGLDHSFTLATLIALLPGLLSWWSGTQLARSLDDPVLPERFMAHQRRNGMLLAAAFVASAIVEPRALPWNGPLLFSTVLAAGYPARRAIYGETWSFTAYLSFFHRLTIGVLGVWMVLAAIPAVGAMAGRFDWIAGAAAAGLVIAWDRHYSRVLRYLLRCQPLEDGPLLARCRQLATKCPLPVPEFLRADLHGGFVAKLWRCHRFAETPSSSRTRCWRDSTKTRSSRSAATSSRTSSTTRRRGCGASAGRPPPWPWLARQRLRSRVCSVSTAPGPTCCGLGALVAVMAFRVRDKQRQETVCDARAVELTGNPEPLVSGLTKLYAAARLPRRIAAPQDRAASHPSLSRRIRDIRRAAGIQPRPLGEAVTIYSSDGSSVVSFEEAGLSWQQDAGVSEVIDYAHLHELRLDVGRRHGPRLVAVSARHRSWEMRVSAADVPRLQAVLDSVDGRLGDAPATRGLSPVFSRCLVAVLSLLALSIGQLTVAVVVLLAALRPARPLVGGAAAAAFAAALLVVRDGRHFGGLAALVLGVAGGVLMALAILNRHQEARSTRLPVAALSVLAALLLGSIVFAGLDPVRLHQSARATPALPVLLVSIASALAWTRQRRPRFAAAAMALLAASTAVLSSQAFLDAFRRDPFLVDAPAITLGTVDATSVDRFALPEATARVLLSPTGRFVAAQMDMEGEDHHSVMFHVGRLGDPLTAIAADTVRFVGDDTVLAGEDDQEGTTLRQVRLNSTQEVLSGDALARRQPQGAAVHHVDRHYCRVLPSRQPSISRRVVGDEAPIERADCGLSVSNGRFAAIVFDGDGATLRVYRLSEPAGQLVRSPLVR